MKRILATILSGLLLVGAVIVGRANRADAADEVARTAAIRLYRSLTDEQKKAALLDFNDKDRRTQAFPAVKRPGVAFSQLSVEQKTMVEAAVKAMTSKYGARRCLETTKETPENLRFLTFFGEPGNKGPFAWRVAMHHLTLLYAEFDSNPVHEFGPILLGGNPAKTRWDDEEKIALELYDGSGRARSRAGSQARISRTTLPWTSVRRKSRPA